MRIHGNFRAIFANSSSLCCILWINHVFITWITLNAIVFVLPCFAIYPSITFVLYSVTLCSPCSTSSLYPWFRIFGYESEPNVNEFDAVNAVSKVHLISNTKNRFEFHHNEGFYSVSFERCWESLFSFYLFFHSALNHVQMFFVIRLNR